MRPLILLSFFLSACLLDRTPGSLKAAPQAIAPTAELQARLRAHVVKLATEIGQRSYRAPEGLEASAAFIAAELRSYENAPTASVRVLPYKIAEMPTERLHRCTEQTCKAPSGEPLPKPESIAYKNIELEIRGHSLPDQVIVVGAHYDSDSCESGGCNPGADDNATGVAAMLELARNLHGRPMARTVRFVAFTNEEEPFFHTEAMGSLVYAKTSLKGNERVVAMLSLETMGYYTDAPESQDVPWILNKLYDLPTVGNFITFVGNWDSEELVKRSVAHFERAVAFPVEGLATYSWVEGVDWSDHWAYWEDDVPAIMITDTAPNRNKCYHQPCDTVEKLDFARFATVVQGVEAVVVGLANE